MVRPVEKREPDDRFETHFRATSRERIATLAEATGLEVETCRAVLSSAQFARVLPFALIELVVLRLVSAPARAELRPDVVGVLRKPSAVPSEEPLAGVDAGTRDGGASRLSGLLGMVRFLHARRGADTAPSGPGRAHAHERSDAVPSRIRPPRAPRREVPRPAGAAIRSTPCTVDVPARCSTRHRGIGEGEVSTAEDRPAPTRDRPGRADGEGRSAEVPPPEADRDVRERRSRRRTRTPLRDRPAGPSDVGLPPDDLREAPLRVLVLDPTGRRPGYCHDFCNALAARGSTVHLWTTEEARRSAARCATRRYRSRAVFGRSASRCDRARSVGAAKGPGRLRRVRHAVGRFGSLARRTSAALRYDVVHWQGERPRPLDALWLRWIGRRATVACTVHAPPEEERACRSPGWPDRLGASGYGACDRVFAHTAEEARRLRDRGVPDEHVVRIRRGSASHLLDRELLEPGLPGRGERPVVLHLGPVSRSSGVDVLLRAVNHLRRYVWDFRVVVAGRCDGEPGAWEDLVRDLGVDRLVELRIGRLREHQVGGYVAAATVVALPHREPRNGDAAVAACTFGKPVVGSRVAGLSELVRAAGNGLLVPPGDPAALAEALAELLRDPDRRRRCETNSLIYARTELSWHRVAEDTRAAYRAVGRPGSAGR